MKYDIYFKEANNIGINELELYISSSSKLSFSLFHGELDNFSSANTYLLQARGIFNNKFGYAQTEKNDKISPKLLVEQIKENASLNEAKEDAKLFKGSEKYFKKNVYNPHNEKIPTEYKIALAKEMENALRQKDKRIIEVEISYEEIVEEIQLINSYGLNLKNKSNFAYYYVSAVAQDNGDETKTAYKIAFSDDFDNFDGDSIVNEVLEKTISQLGGKPCLSKQYKTVLAKNVTSSLLSFFLNSCSAEAIYKKSSLLVDKLNKQVASKKVTIEERPLTKNMFFRYFDDEGVATSNKKIVDKGILKTYLYDIKNAERFSVNQAGNGYKNSNGKVGISFVNPYLKPGSKSLEQVFEEIQDGIYITNVQGLHAGMNPQSGNFSLQASGYLIENGKKGKPVTLITVAGNLFTMLQNVKEVCSDSELLSSGFTCSSIYIKSLAISGI